VRRSLHLVLLVAFSLSLILSSLACGGSRVNLTAGDLYSIESGDGAYSIVKILAVDDDIVHIRLYKNRFATRPEDVDTSELSLGSIQDEDGFGIGHLPISRSEFEAWDPQFLQSVGVTEEELEGYRLWQEAVGE
jgi:hypothetical protein